MKKTYDCGIDLGTTNSCIALSLDGKEAEVIESTTDNLSTTPSAVYISKSGKMMIGQSAYMQADRKNVALQFKRIMGTNEKKIFKSSGEERTPEELSAEVLKKLRQDYKARTGLDAMDVIITIPAAFTSLQNEATQKAAALAGFRNALLLQEPIAASIAYGIMPEAKDKYWMVFDYGGGTLDVAIVSTLNGRLKVINTEGDNFFGGCDLDSELLDKIVLPKLREEYAISDPARPELRNRLLLEVEGMKKTMGNKASAPLLISGIFDDEQEEIEFDYEVTREEFDATISHIVDNSIEVAKKALEGSKIAPEQLEKILLVGGSTYVELVRNKLKETFQKDIDISVNPMHAVAIGAAIFAANNYVDVADESQNESIAQISVKSTYLPQTDKDKATLMCQFDNLPSGQYFAEIKNPVWGTGYVELEATGTLKVQLNLMNEGLNTFEVKLYDGFKQECEIKGDTRVDIVKKQQAIKISGAPMTHSVCIGVMSSGYVKLDVILAKNTILPAANTVTYKLGKNIFAGSEDEITFRVYEGEIYDNPMANSLAGDIHIKGTSLKHDVHKDTDVELKISVDENRIIHVWGRFAETGESIPETVLFEKEQVDIEDRFFEIEYLLPNISVSIKKIGAFDAELMNAYRSQYDGICEQYHMFEVQIDCGDGNVDYNSVYKFIERFYEFQTKVIRAERNLTERQSRNTINIRLNNMESMLNEYGSNEAKANFEKMKLQIENADSLQEAERETFELFKQCRQDCLKNMGYLCKQFNDLKKVAIRNRITDEPKYIECEKRGDEAYQNNDVAGMRFAVEELDNYLYARFSSDVLNQEMRIFNDLKNNPGINHNDAKVAILLEQGAEALANKDENGIKMVNEHLRKICVDSANQVAGKIQSDLHTI